MAVFALASCAGGSGNADTPKDSASDKVISGTVTTDGSTSMQKVIGALGEAFESEYSGTTFTYNPTGSGSGITAVSEGRCDIGLSSRALKDEEKAQGLEETVLAYDGIAIVVSPDNSVKELTLEQIADIYTGKVTNWKEVGGNDAPIVVIGREAGSGTRDGFETIVDVKDECQYAQELTATGAVTAAVAANANAIGYASLSAVDESVRAVDVNGVACTEETVKDGSYAVQRPFNFIVKKDAQLSDAAQAFLTYATDGSANDWILEAGCVPVA